MLYERHGDGLAEARPGRPPCRPAMAVVARASILLVTCHHTAFPLRLTLHTGAEVLPRAAFHGFDLYWPPSLAQPTDHRAYALVARRRPFLTPQRTLKSCLSRTRTNLRPDRPALPAHTVPCGDLPYRCVRSLGQMHTQSAASPRAHAQPNVHSSALAILRQPTVPTHIHPPSKCALTLRSCAYSTHPLLGASATEPFSSSARIQPPLDLDDVPQVSLPFLSCLCPPLIYFTHSIFPAHADVATPGKMKRKRESPTQMSA